MTQENGSQSRLPLFRPRPSLIPLRRGKKDKKVEEIWYFAHLFVSFTYGEDRLHFGNKRKKSTFSLYFTQFALSLQREMKSVWIMTALQLNAEIYRAMGEIADNETLLAKVLVYVKSLVPTKEAKTETGWADRFVGAWKDDRSADEIVNDIRSARTANEIDIEL